MHNEEANWEFCRGYNLVYLCFLQKTCNPNRRDTDATRLLSRLSIYQSRRSTVERKLCRESSAAYNTSPSVFLLNEQLQTVEP